MNNKKRMMYVYEEDFNYLTYKILLILKVLNCSEKQLVDYRKLAYIIEFEKSEESMILFRRSVNKQNKLDAIDKEKLLNLYFKGKIAEKNIRKLLFAIEKKGIINLNKNNKYGSVDVSLNSSKIINEIVDNESFIEDREKVSAIKKEMPNIKGIKFSTFFNKVFGNDEVSKWEG